MHSARNEYRFRASCKGPRSARLLRSRLPNQGKPDHPRSVHLRRGSQAKVFALAIERAGVDAEDSRKGGNLSFSPRLGEEQRDLGATQQGTRRGGSRSGQGQLFSMPARCPTEPPTPAPRRCVDSGSCPEPEDHWCRFSFRCKVNCTKCFADIDRCLNSAFLGLF